VLRVLSLFALLSIGLAEAQTVQSSTPMHRYEYAYLIQTNLDNLMFSHSTADGLNEGLCPYLHADPSNHCTVPVDRLNALGQAGWMALNFDLRNPINYFMREVK